MRVGIQQGGQTRTRVCLGVTRARGGRHQHGDARIFPLLLSPLPSYLSILFDDRSNTCNDARESNPAISAISLQCSVSERRAVSWCNHSPVGRCLTSCKRVTPTSIILRDVTSTTAPCPPPSSALPFPCRRAGDDRATAAASRAAACPDSIESLGPNFKKQMINI